MFGVVSSFVQRAYDQISQDLSINGSPAVITIFYGTICGMNDVTHLGWFDIALLSNIPGIIYLAPTCLEEYMAMLDWAMKQQSYPVVIRIPGGAVVETGRKFPADYSDLNSYMVTRRGRKVSIIAAGAFYKLGETVADELKAKGIDCTLINPRYLSGVDSQLLLELTKDHQLTVTLEDGVLDGGFGEKIARFYGDTDMKVLCYENEPAIFAGFVFLFVYLYFINTNHISLWRQNSCPRTTSLSSPVNPVSPKKRSKSTFRHFSTPSQVNTASPCSSSS